MATSFKIKLSKSANQQSIVIVRDDNVNLSAVTSITAKCYTDDLGTPDNTYSFSVQNVSDFIAGTVTITTLNLIGSAEPADEFYTIVLEGNTAAYVSDNAGVGITLEATYQVLANQSLIDVYSSDYSVDRVLMSAFMLLQEMNKIELQDSSNQRRADFISRLTKLKQMLNYA